MKPRTGSAIWLASFALWVTGCGLASDPASHVSAQAALSGLGGATGATMVRLPAALGGGSAQAVLASSAPAQKRHGYGALKPTRAAAPNLDGVTERAPLSLPTTFDISAEAPPPGNQGDTGSCATWSTGYSAMGWWANHLGLSGARFAPMYLYSQVVKGACDTGMPIETPLDMLKSQGIDTQTDYEPMQYSLDCRTAPTSAQKANAAKFKITNYARSDLSKGAKSAIMSVIAAGHPAIVALIVYPEFENASLSNWVVGPPHSGDTAYGGHGVAAFAYDENGVWILNQWGSDWGYHGWAQLSWDFVDGSFNGEANVNDVAAITGTTLTCSDSNSQCGVWAFSGECQNNPSYMLTNCCASCANPAPVLSTPAAWYRIQNVALGTGYSLDTYVMSPTGSYTGQYWKVSPLPSGRYRLSNQFQGDGMSLDTTNDGVNVPEMAASGSYTGQFWTLTPITNGWFRLTNDFLGDGRSLQAGSDARDVLLGTTATVASQYWQITPIR